MKNKLYESPDRLNEYPQYSFMSDKTYPFFYLVNNKEIVVGEEKGEHIDIVEYLLDNRDFTEHLKDVLEYQEIDIDSVDRDDLEEYLLDDGKDEHKLLNYPGRVFIEPKVLTFWIYPETESKLIEIFNKLKNELKNNTDFDEDINKWQVEIINNNNYFLGDEEESELIPITNYKGSHDYSKEVINKHIKSPINKLNKFNNYKNIIYNKKEPLKWRQAYRQEESVIIKDFKKFKNL